MCPLTRTSYRWCGSRLLTTFIDSPTPEVSHGVAGALFGLLAKDFESADSLSLRVLPILLIPLRSLFGFAFFFASVILF